MLQRIVMMFHFKHTNCKRTWHKLMHIPPQIYFLFIYMRFSKYVAKTSYILVAYPCSFIRYATKW